MREGVAIKFFLDRHAFAVEQHLFSLAPLQAALAVPVLNGNGEGHARSPQGYVFPPHSVAEVAQPLETWMADTHSGDFITCMQVRCAAPTQSMHACFCCSLH